MKILIILFHSTKNIGDLAILEATMERFRDHLDAPKFTLLANYPDEPYFDRSDIKVVPSPWAIVGKSKDHSLFNQLSHFLLGIFWAVLSYLCLRFRAAPPSILPGNWRDLFQHYQEADIVIVSGGNQFYSSGKYGWPFPLNAMSLWLAHLFRKPVYTMPQSIGPLKRRWERWMIKFLYSKNQMTFVRERTSLRLAKGLGVNAVNYAPDMAFILRKDDTQKASRILTGLGIPAEHKKVGMTIIAPMGYAINKELINRYYDILAKTIEKIVLDMNYDVCIFRQVSGPSPLENDALANQHVVKKLEQRVADHVHLIDKAFPPATLESLYQHMDIFIASRLHSGIFALCQNVPTVFIGYLSKTLGVLEALNLDQWCIQLSELNENRLWGMIKTIVKQSMEIQSFIAASMPKVFQQADEVIPQIISDYNKVTKNNNHG
jgi:colanic acid/amylovoran biosynthesis protein